MNINRRNSIKTSLSKLKKPRSTVSCPIELLWALIGLLLTIFSTFVEAFFMNLPWNWASQGIHPQSLGVTYQIGAVLLTGCLGGKNAGALSQIAYILLGLTWLPVFAQGGGLGYLQEPSFGYILGFIPGAWLCGWLAFRTRAKLESLAFSAVCGLLIVHLFGLIYLLGLDYFSPAVIPLKDLPEVMMNYSVAPFPGQLVIVCVVAIIAFALRQLLFY
ncbi:MAG: biotin transporter BioY [Microcystaceae cyanobacterium]